jgi:hypothetical protein
MQKLFTILKSIFSIILALLFMWLVALVRLIALLWKPARRSRILGISRDTLRTQRLCYTLKDPAFVHSDPLIYDQYYQSSLGLAVTWDNPDIQLYVHGAPLSTPVSSSDLQTGTVYDIVARVWNGSAAPEVDLPVHFSYLDFGIGTVSNPIGTTEIPRLGVKGGPDHPAFAVVPWKTPETPGHYCIQVKLDPVDDLNFNNNLGQENTNVGVAHSPAVFEFALRNDTTWRNTYHFEVDSYTPGSPPTCDISPTVRDRPFMARQGARRRRARAAIDREARQARHQRGTHPIPEGWQVQIAPEMPALAPDEMVQINVTILPPEGFTGSQTFNVNAFHASGLAGGVTLQVQSAR